MLNLPNLASSPAMSAVAASEVDDQSAVAMARANPAAFATLYRRYVTPVYRYIYSRVGNVADTQDLTAQVFLGALEGLPRYNERGNFAAWLFTIARRRLNDHWRRRTPLPLDPLEEAPEVSDDPDLLAQVSQKQALDQLRRMVSGLSDEEQELLRLRFAAGLTFEQMATVLGRKEAATKMALYRLLQKLKVMWGMKDE